MMNEMEPHPARVAIRESGTFESLLFFAGAGVDGILFAFPVTATGIVREDNVIAWYPVENVQPVVAFSLKDYLTRWMTGSMPV